MTHTTPSLTIVNLNINPNACRPVICCAVVVFSLYKLLSVLLLRHTAKRFAGTIAATTTNTKSELDRSKEDAMLEEFTTKFLASIDAGEDVKLTEFESEHKSISSVLAQEVPSCGLKEIFLTTTPTKGTVLSNSPAGQRYYRLRDILTELQLITQQLKEAEILLSRYVNDIKKLRDEIHLLQSQLQAEAQLRIQAEAKSSLMEKELLRLHRIKSEHNIQREDLRQQMRQADIQLELLRASKDDSDQSTKKVEMMIGEMQADHARTKEELLTLREKNKSLVQTTAHERQHREQLLRDISELKAGIAEITPKTIRLEDNDDEKSTVVGFSFPSGVHWRTQQLRLMQNNRGALDLNNLRNREYDDSDVDEVLDEEDDVSF